MRNNSTSLRKTLVRIIMVTAVSALALACAGFVMSDLVTWRRALQQDLITLADVIGSNSTVAVTFGDAQEASKILQASSARPSIVAARIFAHDGSPLASRLAPGAQIELPQAAPALGARFTGSHVEVVRPILLDHEIIGIIYVASDLRDIRSRVTHYLTVGLCIVLLAVLTAFVVSRLLERVVTDPILRLAYVAGRVRSERDYLIRMPVDESSPREIRDLMSAFNEMLDEIQRRDEELERRREDLTEQVAVRTSELRSANTELIDSKDAAERIAQLNENLSRHKQAILDTAAEGIFGLDANGNATFINMAAARLLGGFGGTLAGSRLHDIIHSAADAAKDWRECPVCSPFLDPPLRAGRTTEFVATDGRRFPVEYTASTMFRQGVAGVVVTFRDITERLAVERMKDEFVSTVSHELRTPLTSIRGALGLLASGLLMGVDGRAKRMLDIALSNTDRLVRLINDILDLERISSGRVQLSRKLTSAADLAREAIEVVQPVADRASVTIEQNADHTLLWIDRDRMIQTLTNLLSNTVKFSPPGSVVSVRGELAYDAFRFAVVDRGRGIPADMVEKIFERFQQVDASDSRDRGGTGLGLAICRSIVSAHGGRIWAESAVGEGSTFFVTLPALMPHSTSHQVACPGAVLVCAEDVGMATSVVEMLESRGHRAFAVPDCAQAVDCAGEFRPSAIVLVSNCGAMLETLRTAPATSGMPLIIASEKPPSRFESHADPITAWVRSPFTGADLVSALAATRKHLETRPVLVIEDGPVMNEVAGAA